MSKTLGNNVQRATRGLGLAVTVGAVGAALTAAVLIGQGGARPNYVPFQVTGPIVEETPAPEMGEIGTAIDRPAKPKRSNR